MTTATPAKPNVPLPVASRLAERVIDELRSSCERIEVAGSIRRHKPIVHDIDLVAIPKLGDGLFPGDANAPTRLDEAVGELVRGGRLQRVRGGPKATTLKIPAVPGLHIELWTCNANTWGWIHCLRTGPAEFTRALVTNRRQGGHCPSHLRFFQGRVYREGNRTPIAVPSEQALFDLLEMPCLPPEGRA
ncbi:MAG: hypothetical protein AAGI54_00580 [Planctomycetota bacterium]